MTKQVLDSLFLAVAWRLDGLTVDTDLNQSSGVTSPENLEQPRESAQLESEPQAATTPSEDMVEESTRRRAAGTIERLLEEAKLFKPRSNHDCKDTETKAIHSDTGTRYTFPSSCIPPGWEVRDEALRRALLNQLRY